MVHLSLPRAAGIFLCLAILAATYPLLLGRFYAIGDMADVFVPLEDFFHQELLAGRLPLWHPDLAWGFPVIASAQIGFFYPPLLLLRWLPLFVYLPLILVLHLFALGIGTYIFARRENISHWGALLAAIVMTLNAFVFQHVTHLNVVLTLTWLPWQFIVIKRLASRSNSSPQDRVVAAIVIAAPFLAGHLHIPFLLALMSTAYYWARRPKPFVRASLTYVSISIFAIALAAVQILPTLELVQYSSRGTSGDFDLERANQLSWPVYHAPTILWPRFFGTDDTYWGKRLEVEYGIFLGTLPLLLIALAIRPLWRDRRWFVIAATSGLVLALGDFSPIRLLWLEPSLWYFSAPARWLLLYTFAMSILAGAGLDAVQQYPRRLRQGTIYFLIALGIMVAVYNVALANVPDNFSHLLAERLNSYNLLGERPLTYYSEKFSQLLASLQQSGLSVSSPYTFLPLLVLGAAALVTSYRAAPALIVTLTALELVLVAATATPTLPWSTILATPSTLASLPTNVQQKQARILSRLLPGDTGLFLTNPASRANPQKRARQRDLLVPATHARFNIAGSQWPASLDLNSHSAALATLTKEELNIGAVLVETPHGQPPLEIQILPAEPRVALVSDKETVPLLYQPVTPTLLRWQVAPATTSQLIVRDTFYPGWRAFIDGQLTPLLPYQSVFRQVTVPAGRHQVTMQYQPTLFYWGLGISVVSALLAISAWFRRLKHTAPPQS